MTIVMVTVLMLTEFDSTWNHVTLADNIFHLVMVGLCWLAFYWKSSDGDSSDANNVV